MGGSTRIQAVLDHLPQHEQAQVRPTEQDFSKTKARLQGAAGPDTWTAEGLGSLPAQATKAFVEMTQVWERHGADRLTSQSHTRHRISVRSTSTACSTGGTDRLGS